MIWQLIKKTQRLKYEKVDILKNKKEAKWDDRLYHKQEKLKNVQRTGLLLLHNKL